MIRGSSAVPKTNQIATPEMCCLLNFSDRLHQGVLHNEIYIRTRKSICAFAKSSEIGLRQRMWSLSKVNLEHRSARGCIRQCDVDSLVKAPANGRVQSIWQVGGAKNEHFLFFIVAYTLCTRFG